MAKRTMGAQRGAVSTGGIAAGVLALAAAGAGFFAWQTMGSLDQVQMELASTKNQLDRARGELRKLQQDTTSQAKELTELRLAADQARAERDSVRKFLEAEQSTGVRLREEATLLKQQISYLTARTPASVVKGMPQGVRK